MSNINMVIAYAENDIKGKRSAIDLAEGLGAELVCAEAAEPVIADPLIAKMRAFWEENVGWAPELKRSTRDALAGAAKNGASLLVVASDKHEWPVLRSLEDYASGRFATVERMNAA